MVLQEDGDPNNGGCSYRTGFSPKKPKPNKIPQRGLGIAALEKLRREDQQKRIAAAFSTGDNIAATASCAGGIGSGEHLSVSVIVPTPFFPLLEQSTKPCFFGNYALLRPHADASDGSSRLVWNSIQSDISSNSNSQLPLPPRKLQQEQHRCSMVIKNILSPPLSSGASLQMEPPSNQSYVSINPPSMPEQKLYSVVLITKEFLRREMMIRVRVVLDSISEPKVKLLSLMEAYSALVFCLFQNLSPCKQYRFRNILLIVCNIFRKAQKQRIQKLLAHLLFTISWICLMISLEAILVMQILNPKINANTDHISSKVEIETI